MPYLGFKHHRNLPSKLSFAEVPFCQRGSVLPSKFSFAEVPFCQRSFVLLSKFSFVRELLFCRVSSVLPSRFCFAKQVPFCQVGSVLLERFRFAKWVSFCDVRSVWPKTAVHAHIQAVFALDPAVITQWFSVASPGKSSCRVSPKFTLTAANACSLPARCCFCYYICFSLRLVPAPFPYLVPGDKSTTPSFLVGDKLFDRRLLDFVCDGDGKWQRYNVFLDPAAAVKAQVARQTQVPRTRDRDSDAWTTLEPATV